MQTEQRSRYIFQNTRWAIRGFISGGASDLSHQNVQTHSGAHLASYSIRNGGSVVGNKATAVLSSSLTCI